MAATDFSWASSDTLVARVDDSGQVTAAANGSATITATAGSASGTAGVTVAQMVSAVAVSPAVDTLAAFGDTVRLTAEATDANGHAVAATEFSWASSDTRVARVDGSGLVESVAAGAVVVTATASEVTGGADLRVIGADCTSYYELTYDDGSHDCIKVPRVVYTFTPRGGRERIESSSDPTEVIKVYFDSEVVYLSESGEWREITKEDILEMVEISLAVAPSTGPRPSSIDHVGTDAAIGLDLVSVDDVGNKTVITIESPYDPRTWDGKIYRAGASYNIVVKSFAKKTDLSKIVGSNSLASYLEDTKTFYKGEFGASRYYNASSCDLAHRPSGGSYAQYHDSPAEAGAAVFQDELYNFSYMNLAGSSLPSAANVAPRDLERADPGTRYVIDVAFVIANSLLEDASGNWMDYLGNDVLGLVSQMFQDSGVNVEFRASVISPFSAYRQHLLCDLPALDDLVITRTKEGDGYGWSSGEAIALLELIPGIRRRHPADIFIAMLPGWGGYASVSGALGFVNPYEVSRWESFAIVRAPGAFFDLGDPSNRRVNYTHSVGGVLAHEIGHVLGLHHDLDTLVESGLPPTRFGRPGITATGFGYGYGGYLSGLPIGTIMSYPGSGQAVQVFSADREVMRSELCDDDTAAGASPLYGYCRASDPQPDRPVRLGGPYKYGVTVDATEALQYTIGYAAEYFEAGLAPSDLLTVSNSITAKALRGKR